MCSGHAATGTVHFLTGASLVLLPSLCMVHHHNHKIMKLCVGMCVWVCLCVHMCACARVCMYAGVCSVYVCSCVTSYLCTQEFTSEEPDVFYNIVPTICQEVRMNAPVTQLIRSARVVLRDVHDVT